MSIKVHNYTDGNGNPEPEISLICDGCGKEYWDTEDHSHWSCRYNDPEQVAFYVRDDVDYTQYQGWHHDDGQKDYCPRCAHYNDVHLDALVIHPVTKLLKEVIDFGLKMSKEGHIDGGKLILPLDTGRKAKCLIGKYRDLLLKLNEELADAREELRQYKEDESGTRDFFDNQWTKEDLLDLRRERLERLAKGHLKEDEAK